MISLTLLILFSDFLSILFHSLFKHLQRKAIIRELLSNTLSIISCRVEEFHVGVGICNRQSECGVISSLSFILSSWFQLWLKSLLLEKYSKNILVFLLFQFLFESKSIQQFGKVKSILILKSQRWSLLIDHENESFDISCRRFEEHASSSLWDGLSCLFSLNMLFK